jgi:hypothetical protein
MPLQCERKMALPCSAVQKRERVGFGMGGANAITASERQAALKVPICCELWSCVSTNPSAPSVQKDTQELNSAADRNQRPSNDRHSPTLDIALRQLMSLMDKAPDQDAHLNCSPSAVCAGIGLHSHNSAFGTLHRRACCLSEMTVVVDPPIPFWSVR